MKKLINALFRLLKNEHGAALTPTYPLGAQGVATEFGGQYRLYIFSVTPTTNTDTITLVRATDKIGTILKIWTQITTGTGSGFSEVEPTFSGLVITLKTYNAAGAVATTWGNIDVFVLAS